MAAGLCVVLLSLAGIPETCADRAAGTCFLLPAAAASGPEAAGTDNVMEADSEGADGADTPQGGLTIEVVKELSIDDQIIIEDGEIPLANFSEAPAKAGPRHAAMMGIVLLAEAGYTIYFDRREKRLFVLLREAALAQKEIL